MTKYAIGIDIGGTNSKIGLITSEGKVIDREIFSTVREDSFEKYSLRLKAAVKELVSRNSIEVIGIGVGAPNANFLTGKVHNPPNLSWGTVDLKGILEKQLNSSVWVDNDANLAAAGEVLWGVAKGVKNLLVVTLGTGVGTGIIVDGKILQGALGGAGEGGHIEIIPNGRECGCGGLGHLECYASATGMKQTIKELLGRDEDLAKLGNSLSSGNSDSKLIFERSAEYLGSGLAIMASILFPEMIVLTGGVMKTGPLYLDMISNVFEQKIFRTFKSRVKLELSTLPKEDGAILGAASLVFHNSVK